MDDRRCVGGESVTVRSEVSTDHYNLSGSIFCINALLLTMFFSSQVRGISIFFIEKR